MPSLFVSFVLHIRLRPAGKSGTDLPAGPPSPNRYGAWPTRTPHMAASVGNGFGGVVEGLSLWSCTSPPPPMPLFNSRVLTWYGTAPFATMIPNWEATPGSPLSTRRTRNITGCGSLGLLVVAQPQISRAFGPTLGTVRYPVIWMLLMWY